MSDASNGDSVSVAPDPLDGGSSEHAYEQVRKLILSGDLAPDTTFSQVQLSTQLGVSRTPLREAIRRLQSEGLLRSEHNRRVRVSPLSTSDFEVLYAMRIVFDSLAVRITVPQLTDADIAEMTETMELATQAAASGDLAGYTEPHERFHFALFKYAGARLIGQVQDLWDHAFRYRLLYQENAVERRQLVQLASLDHAAILAAAEQRDAEVCAQRSAAHLARTALMTMIRVDPSHDPLRIRSAMELVHAEDPPLADRIARDSAETVDVLGYLRDADPAA